MTSTYRRFKYECSITKRNIEKEPVEEKQGTGASNREYCKMFTAGSKFKVLIITPIIISGSLNSDINWHFLETIEISDINNGTVGAVKRIDI